MEKKKNNATWLVSICYMVIVVVVVMMHHFFVCLCFFFFVHCYLTGTDPSENPQEPLPFDLPQVSYKYIKLLSHSGHQADAIQHLYFLIDALSNIAGMLVHRNRPGNLHLTLLLKILRR